MNRTADFSKLGGLWTYQDTLEFMQNGYSGSLDAIAKMLGEKYVLTGCTDNGATVDAGWIVVSGEIVYFQGGNKLAKINVVSTITQEQFDDGNLKDFYTVKVGQFSNISGFDYEDLNRLPYSSSSLADCLSNVQKILNGIIQFEPEVILSGCEVSNVDDGAMTLDIAAGLVMFNGSLLNSIAYSGTYPCFLQENGNWVTVEPVTGLFIKFDPYTSQRYKNVLDRAMTPTGRIIMEETLSDRFAADGTGQWEMKGYELMSTMQSRVPVGLWYDGVAEGNVRDAVDATVGVKGGERSHTLTTGEMPSHTHQTALARDNNTVGAGSGNGGAVTAVGGGGSIATGNAGSDNPHNNMQPYTVVVYAKRTA